MQIAEELEYDLDWREGELASFKRIVSAASPGSIRERALLRALLAFLYAHYEGFCKYAWDVYLNSIQATATRRGNLRDPLVCLSLEKAFGSLRKDLSAENIWQFYKAELQRHLDDPAAFPTGLETKSNLWPERYRKNMRVACLSSTMMDEHAVTIKSLVSRRNDIAHGQKVSISSLSDYQKFEDAALLVMHELAVSIIESVDDETYLRSTDGQTAEE